MIKKHLTRDDILDIETYARSRPEKKQQMLKIKRHRRIPVGPDATFYFENYDTMWLQIHEMLYIEHGGEAQIQDELLAYTPLIPKGRELIATFMIEIDDPIRRKRVLTELNGVQDAIQLQFAKQVVQAAPTEAEDRTDRDGKTSSVHFLRFSFTPPQIKAFQTVGEDIILEIKHPSYSYKSLLDESTRKTLALDFEENM